MWDGLHIIKAVIDAGASIRVLDRSYIDLGTPIISNLGRYDVLCQKLVKENLYAAACTLASPRAAVTTGDFSDMSELSSLKLFVTAFSSRIAAEAARS